MTAVQYMVIGANLRLQSQLIPYSEQILFQMKCFCTMGTHPNKNMQAWQQMATTAHSIAFIYLVIYCKNRTWNLFCLKTKILNILH
jgi:hypothetical protein